MYTKEHPEHVNNNQKQLDQEVGAAKHLTQPHTGATQVEHANSYAMRISAHFSYCPFAINHVCRHWLKTSPALC